MSARTWPIRVRLARPDDRAAVLAFATNTWDGYDYIPEVWDEWVVPDSGLVLVATVEAPVNGGEPRDADGAALEVDQPIAMTRVVMLSDREAWLEGIRVDPRVRGLGVATDLQVAELRWIVAHRGRVVRYLTSEVNVGSQRLGARHGLLEIGRWRTYRTADHEQRRARSAEERTIELVAAFSRLHKTPADAWPRFRDDPTFAASHRLYEYRPWAFQELTEARFQRHVERHEVVTSGGDASWAALMVNRRLLAEGELHVASARGDPPALMDLLQALGRPQMRIAEPDPKARGPLADQLKAAGYEPWKHSFIVVERPLDENHPLPEADDPGLLLYGDEPRHIVVPPVLRG